jgi:hypothetical protein
MVAKPHSATNAPCTGVFATNEVYSIEEAKRRLGWSDSAMRAAKRRGLSLLRSGKRRYVTGQEILRFLQEETKQSSSNP